MWWLACGSSSPPRGLPRGNGVVLRREVPRVAVYVDLVAPRTIAWILGVDLCLENEIERKMSEFWTGVETVIEEKMSKF